MSLSSLSPNGASGARRVASGFKKKKKRIGVGGTPSPRARGPNGTPPDSLTRVGSASSSGQRLAGARSSRRALKQQQQQQSPQAREAGEYVMVASKSGGPDRRAIVRKWIAQSRRVTVQYVKGGVSIVDPSQIRDKQPSQGKGEQAAKHKDEEDDEDKDEFAIGDDGDDADLDYGEDIDKLFGADHSPVSSPAPHGLSKARASGLSAQLPPAAVNAPSPGSSSSVSNFGLFAPKEKTAAAAEAPAAASLLPSLSPPSISFPTSSSSSSSSSSLLLAAGASKGKGKSKGLSPALISSPFKSNESDRSDRSDRRDKSEDPLRLPTSEAVQKAEKVDAAVQKLLDTGTFLFNETNHKVLCGAAFPRNLSASIQNLVPG